jgi:hypothetical protein
MPIVPARSDTELRMIESADLTWSKSAHGFTLHLRQGPALLTVVPDGHRPGMWRVRAGQLTDTANLTRVKDAAISIALGILRRQKHYRETAAEAPPVTQTVMAGTETPAPEAA